MKHIFFLDSPRDVIIKHNVTGNTLYQSSYVNITCSAKANPVPIFTIQKLSNQEAAQPHPLFSLVNFITNVQLSSRVLRIIRLVLPVKR